MNQFIYYYIIPIEPAATPIVSIPKNSTKPIDSDGIEIKNVANGIMKRPKKRWSH